ncbi:sensor histidine kinase [Alkaliphilus transvaalensis]|uniref:sensor histidine kinase n=1 Tax=Alkaliphilus transvaalensis TaxID=114628 RepID=UPI0005522CEB|nr:sensor histidine kinase [Alkaliphilus transvaalensis]
MEYFNTKKKKLLLICCVTSFMGQIFINPFSTDFRISLSVVAFSLLIFWYKELEIIPTAVVTGIFLFGFRVLITKIFTESSLINLMIIHYPVIIYYLTFGIFLRLLRFREYHKEALLALFVLSFSDSLSNIVEVMIRREGTDLQGINTIFFVGILRAFMAVLVMECTRYYELFLRKEEHEKRYKQLILLTSNLKSEVFFLRKSMDDMENAMEKSYQLYQQLKELPKDQLQEKPNLGNLSFQALSIAKDIHEIKKDYLRVSVGLEKVLPDMENDKGMYIKELLNLVKDSCDNYSIQMDKQILLDFNYNNNIFIKESYELISIINNLVTNGIEAIEKRGLIKVTANSSHDFLEIYVDDDGAGIASKNIEIIFEAGYSTKFDKLSGKMSSGIGLTHVAYLVKTKLDGEISVKSKEGEGTCFKVTIPLKNV